MAISILKNKAFVFLLLQISISFSLGPFSLNVADLKKKMFVCKEFFSMQGIPLFRKVLYAVTVYSFLSGIPSLYTWMKAKKADWGIAAKRNRIPFRKENTDIFLAIGSYYEPNEAREFFLRHPDIESPFKDLFNLHSSLIGKDKEIKAARDEIITRFNNMHKNSEYTLTEKHANFAVNTGILYFYALAYTSARKSKDTKPDDIEKIEKQYLDFFEKIHADIKNNIDMEDKDLANLSLNKYFYFSKQQVFIALEIFEKVLGILPWYSCGEMLFSSAYTDYRWVPCLFLLELYAREYGGKELCNMILKGALRLLQFSMSVQQRFNVLAGSVCVLLYLVDLYSFSVETNFIFLPLFKIYKYSWAARAVYGKIIFGLARILLEFEDFLREGSNE